jgi:mercuric ion binding protein
MNTKYFICSIACCFIALFSFAQKATTDTIKVWGNCGMCKSTIEKAATKAGASTAVWNEDTKKLVVTYNAGKTSNQKIQQQVAAAGYDTEKATASEAAYKSLHACCQYDRKEAAATTAHSCCKDTSKCTTAGCCTKADMSCCKGDNATHDCCKKDSKCCGK